MAIKAVIFDVDGVLCNSLDTNSKYLWGKDVATDLGLHSVHFKKIYSPAWDLVTRGKKSTIAHLNEVLTDESFNGLNLTAERYIDYWLSHDVFVNHEMITLAARLPVATYAGTNQDYHRSMHIKNMLGHAVTGFFTSYEIGHIKPEAGFYEHIEKQLSLQPQEILLIDDTCANIAAASTRGWQVFHYTNNFETLRTFLSRAC